LAIWPIAAATFTSRPKKQRNILLFVNLKNIFYFI
jgi:hypothetical protein